MAAAYRKTPLRRLGNALITPLVRLGLAGKGTHILTVPGRKSGRRYSTPVQLVIDDAGRWLVAPYGEREWVKNARVAGEVDLMRAGRTKRHRIEELGPDEAAPVLREYVRTTSIVKPYFSTPTPTPPWRHLPLRQTAIPSSDYSTNRIGDAARLPMARTC